MEKQTREERFEGYAPAEIMDVAGTLKGIDRMKAYQSAGRRDLSRDIANAQLQSAATEGLDIFKPYTSNEWDVLRYQSKFDDASIEYDSAVVKDAVKKSALQHGYGAPTLEEMANIEGVLEEQELSKDEKMQFFKNSRDKAKADPWDNEVRDFCYDGKETMYSYLAEKTGVPRNEVVSHYMGVVLKNRNVLNEKVANFIERESVPNEEVISAVEEAQSNDKQDRGLYLMQELSGLPQIQFPKEMVVSALQKYTSEGHWVDGNSAILKGLEGDMDIISLQEKSLKRAVNRPRNISSSWIARRITDTVDSLDLNPNKGWLGRAIKRNMKNWLKSDSEYDMDSAAIIGEKYNLLPEEKIAELKRKSNLIRALNSD